VEPDQTVLRWHDTEGRAHLTLGGSADERARAAQQADAERLGEDLRKLYVALTRARHATWVGVAPLDDLHRSALGYLVGAGQPIALHDWPTPLAERLAGPTGTVTAAPMPTTERWEAPAEAPTRGQCRTYRGQPRPRWWIASYSALRIADEATAAPDQTAADAPDTPLQDRLREITATSPADAPADGRPEPDSLHAFPRGASAGTLLHDLLEWCAQQGFAAVAHDPTGLRDQVARRCQARDWAHWIDPLTTWLHGWLTTAWPLPGGGPSTSLAGLASYRAELEFWLPTASIDTLALDRLVTRHTLGGAPRPALQADRLHGMLKGYIDLVFEHGGRYYVADYKSNWLGPHSSAYTTEALRQAVLDARYDLQYTLYLVALHRLLRHRLPGYDYDRHVGGAVYLFLRGDQGPAQGTHLDRPPRVLIDTLDRWLDQGAGGEPLP